MTLEFLLKSFKEEDKPTQADKGEISLTGILQRQRLKLSKSKEPRPASLNFNPYAIAYGFCMREKVSQLVGLHEIWVKPPTPKEQLIFDVGHKYHDIIQGYFWKTGMLDGDWLCKFCNSLFSARAPEVCPSCYCDELVYREVPVYDDEYHIKGRSDGIIWVEVAKNVEEKHIMDIKSISNRGKENSRDPKVYFEDLDIKGPLPTHVVQLSLYMRALSIFDGHLLYVGKNSQQMKSFHIKYNEDLLAPYLYSIRQALQWATELKDGIRQELPAPCSSGKCECESIVYSYERIKEVASGRGDVPTARAEEAKLDIQEDSQASSL